MKRSIPVAGRRRQSLRRPALPRAAWHGNWASICGASPARAQAGESRETTSSPRCVIRRACSKRRPRAATCRKGVDDQDKYGSVRYQPLTKIRKTIAANMARSSQTIPHVTNFDDADITELERIRKDSSADYAKSDLKLTMMAFVMKAVAQSLKLHPMLNASLDLENNRVIFKDYVNLGIAVDTERGLVVPVIRDADQLTIPQIAQALTDVTNKGRASQFTIDDLRGGTFTISNLGAVGGTYSTPIINYPEVAVLLTGRSRDDADRGGRQDRSPRLMMPLSLSYDHRLVDGAVGRAIPERSEELPASSRPAVAGDVIGEPLSCRYDSPKHFVTPAPTDETAWAEIGRHWSFAPGVTFLNHGSFGAPPAEVLAARQQLLARLAQDPVDFMQRFLHPAMAEVRARLGPLLGADPDRLVFVENATVGMNAVACSVPLRPGR